LRSWYIHKSHFKRPPKQFDLKMSAKNFELQAGHLGLLLSALELQKKTLLAYYILNIFKYVNFAL